MFHGTEEWLKVWGKANVLFQKRRQFGEYGSDHSKD